MNQAVNGETPVEQRVVWTAEALRRVEDAPAFVRPGIRKLTGLRARQRGYRVITSEFLSEIRNESMLRVSKSIKKFGFEELGMDAFEVAKEKMRNHPRKLEVIDEIQQFLGQRTERNKEIMEQFARYFEIVPKQGIPWTTEALERLNKMPTFVRSMAKTAIEEQARKMREVVISAAYLETALSDLLPDAQRFMASMFGSSGDQPSIGPGGPAAPGTPGAQGVPSASEHRLVPLEELPLSMPWEEEPLQRLRRVPIDFVRERLIRRVERSACRQGAAQVSAPIFAAARFLSDDQDAG